MYAQTQTQHMTKTIPDDAVHFMLFSKPLDPFKGYISSAIALTLSKKIELCGDFHHTCLGGNIYESLEMPE